MFCKPFFVFRKKSNSVEIFLKTPVSPWFTGVFPVLPVDNPVENVDNFWIYSPYSLYIFNFM